MIRSDVIVIGSGLAGLTAALASARRNKKVTLLTYGSGSLVLNAGTIDLLGRDEKNHVILSPKTALKSLPAAHPYRKIGVKAIESAVNFFKELVTEFNLPYVGSIERQIFVPTAAGTLKDSVLVPESMNGDSLINAEKIIVVGVKGLKDFYSEMIANNLKRLLDDKKFKTLEIDLGLSEGRDLTTLDVAHWLDDEANISNFVKQLKIHADKNSVFVIPQILGTTDANIYHAVKNRLDAEIVETTCLPPSPNGLRLQKIFYAALQESGVEIVEDAKVIRALTNKKFCTGVVTQTAAREKNYFAEKIILATGGFYSGGIVMKKFEEPHEVIFNLPVYFEAGENNWSNENLFSDKPQGFAKTGILVDENLLPIDSNGKRVFENVHVVGANLGGFDFCFEGSGNGVALASAYKAASI